MDTSAPAASVLKLMDYIEAENYEGYDPYDTLKSPLFRLPFFKSNKWVRFYAQQMVKRLHINLRPLFFVPRGRNPVTLGLCIEAYANLITVFPERKESFSNKIDSLISELVTMIPGGFHGACWGYDFDWEARYVRIPAYQPTIVATGIISNSLFKAYKITGHTEAFSLCERAAEFVLQDINRTYAEDGSFCFSYSPFDRLSIFNASMKGVRLLAQVFSVTGKEALREAAEKAVTYVVNHQRKDGAWFYSLSQSGAWIDNYHTGYILDCLHEYARCTGDQKFEANLERGYYFYRKNFFTEEGIPRHHHDQTYPVDCTSAAQSILTLKRFGDVEPGLKISEWMIRHMQDESGYFYFLKFKHHTVRTSFMRWSNAWMFAALAELNSALKTINE
jgi:rhamnogalacturonyl hydrolase YesR